MGLLLLVLLLVVGVLSTLMTRGSTMKKKLISYNVAVPRHVTNKLRSILPPALDISSAGVLVVNLLSCTRKDSRLVYSRDNTRKKQMEMYYFLYNRKRISTYRLVKVVDWMCANGWCYGSIGSRELVCGETRDFPSWVCATSRLTELFSEPMIEQSEQTYRETLQTILLRDKEKELIEYDETQKTKSMRRIVQALNEVNASYTFIDSEGALLDNSKIVRIFNGSFASGGRFYRHDILTLPNSILDDNGQKVRLEPGKTRLGVTIDGENVAEVDFVCLHPTLLYDLCRLERPWLNDLYSYLGAGTECERNALKVAVNVLLNARTRRAAICALEKELPKYGVSTNASDLVKHIEEKLVDVKNMLCNNVSTGLWLQNVESEIMSRVAEMFVQENAPLLPVHDSAIVREKDVDTLVQSMGKYYCELVEEYTDSVWASNVSVLMKISTKNSSKVLTFKGGVVYN